MALESPPEAGALWLDNWLLSATVANNFGQRALYPLSNLLSPHRSETWRSPDVSNTSGGVFDMGQIRTPTAFAIGDVNFSGSQYVQLLGADDSSLTINVVSWTLPLYAQDSSTRILKWYLGDPSSGSIGSSTNSGDAASARGRQFWCIRLLPGTYSYDVTDDFFEIGFAWIGPYTAITPDQGVRIGTKDPSDRQKAYGLAQWTDPLRPYHRVDLTLAGLTFSELYALKKLITAQGSSHAILDVHAYSSDATIKGGSCFYGYFEDTPSSSRLNSPTDNELSLSFEDASG